MDFAFQFSSGREAGLVTAPGPVGTTNTLGMCLFVSMYVIVFHRHCEEIV